MPLKITKESIIKYNNIGDPLADDTVCAIFGKVENSDTRQLSRMLLELIDTEKTVPDDNELTPAQRQQIQKYLDQSKILPPWLDENKIKVGAEFFEKNGLLAFVILNCSSLPEDYTADGGLEVLWLTQKLKKHTHRRLIETCRFLMDVSMHGGLISESGVPVTTLPNGIKSAQKVRLMHAAMRHLVLHEPPPTAQSKEVGKNFSEVLLQHRWRDGLTNPIAQSFMAGTLLSFSYIVLRDLPKLGVEFLPAQDGNPGEVESFLHLWNVVGYLLGLNEDFIFDNIEEAEQLYNLVWDPLRRSTPAGISLTKALIKFLKTLVSGIPIIGFFSPMRVVPKLLMLELLGDFKCGLLGVKKSFLDSLMLLIVRPVMWLLGRLQSDLYKDSGFFEMLGKWLFRKIATNLTKMSRGEERMLFAIPTTLALRWGLKR